MISAPLGVRGPLRAPPGKPTGSSWGLPWPLLRPQRKTQPTVVISVRTASLFCQNGPGAREGCTFLETLFFSVLSKPPPSPWGSCGRFLRPTPKRAPKAAPRTRKGPQKEPPKAKLGKKGPPKRTRTNIKYKISNIKWINKHYMSNIKLFTLGEIKPNANIKYQM